MAQSDRWFRRDKGKTNPIRWTVEKQVFHKWGKQPGSKDVYVSGLSRREAIPT